MLDHVISWSSLLLDLSLWKQGLSIHFYILVARVQPARCTQGQFEEWTDEQILGDAQQDSFRGM